MTTCGASAEESSQLTLFAEDSPARTSPLPDAARAWLESAADSGTSSIEYYRKLNLSGLSSKMSPAYYPAPEEEILPPSFKGWRNSGMALPGGFLTLNTSEFPSAASVCLLSDILETDVPPKYYLSAKACRGILRRAERRGKKLPAALAAALASAAGQTTPTE